MLHYWYSRSQMVIPMRTEHICSHFSVEHSCKLTLLSFFKLHYEPMMGHVFLNENFQFFSSYSRNTENWALESEQSLIRTSRTRSFIARFVPHRKSRTLFPAGTRGRIIALPAPDTSTRPARRTASAPVGPVSPATVDCKTEQRVIFLICTSITKATQYVSESYEGGGLFLIDASIFPCFTVHLWPS